jgi:hypothetical protein
MSNTAPNAIEALDKAVANLVQFSTDKGAKLVDWLYEQAPDVVEQLLVWHFAESLIVFVICFFFIAIYPFVLYKIARSFYVKFDVSKMGDEINFWFPTGVISVLTIALSQVFSWQTVNLSWLKIWLAPKVYLLEYITRIASDK